MKKEVVDVDKAVDAKYAEKKKIYDEIAELSKQKDAIYEEYKKGEEEHKKEWEAEKAIREKRQEMLPLVDQLYDLNVKVFEEPKYSAKFNYTIIS